MSTIRYQRLFAGIFAASAAVAITMDVTVLASRPAVAATSSTHTAAARDATSWMAGEFTDGALPGPFGNSDWGLTIDGLIALAATGVAPTTAKAARDQVAGHIRSYNSYDDYGIPGFQDGGATAKLLFAASAAGADPTDFVGYDLRAETLALIADADTGDQRGRILSQTTPSTGPDVSNTFDQSFAVLGLVRSGGVPQDAVNFLIRQQCAAGGFRLFPDTAAGPSPSCDAQPDMILDVDSTAMAVQALLAAASAGAVGAADAARRGADWLTAEQHHDGSFSGSGPTAGANANSTGLAGQALAAAGQATPAARAADAVSELQVTAAAGGAAASDAGAIAYNAEALTAATASGIGENERDQWRRSTAQAALGLAQIPLGRIGLDPPPSPEPSGTVTPSPSGTAEPSPTRTGTPGPDPSGSATATPSLPSWSRTPTPKVSPHPSRSGGGSGGTGRLPTTGAAVTTFVLLALATIGSGAVLLVVARRRAA